MELTADKEWELAFGSIIPKEIQNYVLISLFLNAQVTVGRLIVVIDVNPSHGFWTTRLIKVFGHEGKCTCIYNTHEWIVYIMLFPVACGTSHGSSWLRRNEFLKMTSELKKDVHVGPEDN